MTQVEESEELFCQTAESIDGCAIFTLDAKGRITSWNTSARTLLAREPQEAIGHTMDDLFTTSSHAGLISNVMDNARASGWGSVELQRDARHTERPQLLRLTLSALQGHTSINGFLVTLREELVAKIVPVDSIEESSAPRAYDARVTVTSNRSGDAEKWTNDPDVRNAVRLLRNLEPSTSYCEDQRSLAALRSGDGPSITRKPFPGADASESARRPFQFQNSQARALFVELAENQPSS